MRSARMVVVMASVVVLVLAGALAGPVWAVDYSNTAGGNWGDQTIWNGGSSGFPDDNTDTGTITTGTVETKDSGGAAYDIPTLAAGGITINGGMLDVTALQTGNNTATVNASESLKQSADSLANMTVKFNGGKWYTKADAPWDWTNSVSVQIDNGGMTYIGGSNLGQNTTFTGVISDAAGATGKITLDTPGGYSRMTISNAANSFTGGVELKNGTYLAVAADGAASTGTITVNPSATLAFFSPQSQPHTVDVVVKSGGTMQITAPTGVTGYTAWANAEIQGGTVLGANGNAWGGIYVLAGTHTLKGDTKYNHGGKSDTDLRIDAQITEDGGSYKITRDAGTAAKRVYISNGANDYSGGTEVQVGIVAAEATGALGTGDVWVYADAELEITATDAMSQGATLYLLSGSNGLLDLDADQTLSGLDLGGSPADPGVYDGLGGDPMDLSGWVEFDGDHKLTIVGGAVGVPIPEPGTFALLALGLGAMARRKRRA